MAVNGIALGAAGVGALFLWSALNNQKITTSIQDIISGKKPVPGPKPKLSPAQPLATGIATGIIAGAGSNALAGIALSGVGHCYVFGGAPGPSGTGCWDCSSAYNWWRTQAGLPMIGGTWNPSTHGPVTGQWLTTTLLRTVGANSTANAIPGDTIVGLTHMGVYTGNGMYVSAENPSLGTHNDPVSTFPDPLYLVRRG